MTFLKNIAKDDSNDKDLLEAYKATGNLETLAVLFQRYMDLLYAVCLKYLGEGELARDAVMQIFEELVEKLRKHKVENFRGWLHTVAKNHCLMQLRSSRRLKTAEIRPELMHSEDPVHLNGVMTREENLEKLGVCLNGLPAEQRQAVELFYLKGKCYKEIAGIMSIDWNQVRSYIQNGRRNLKICMDKSNPEAVTKDSNER